MASKLKDLEVTKVDFVDQGDNKGAAITLFKKRENPPEEEILKSGGEAETFDEKMHERQLRRASDEIWDYCYALNESLCSILRDQDVPPETKTVLMSQSVAEFSAAVAAAIPKWSAGVPTKVVKAADIQLTGERLQIAREAKARLDDMIQKTEPAPPAQTESGKEPAPTTNKDPVVNESISAKGESADMKIDKSKLSPEELETLEDIEKKAGIPDEAPAAGETDDIYKGMHPAVAEELRNLRKFREEAEDREIIAIAKRYELLGKRPEELARVLKSLRAAGGTAYSDMIGVLDANLAVMQASPAFTEIGKSGYGAHATDADTAWAKIEKKADEIMKSAPTLTRAQAIDKACELNPALVHEYESAR